MSYNGSFTAATEEYIVSKIRKAKYRVAFVGSGFSAKIAKEIACKADIVKNIIFDNDTEETLEKEEVVARIMNSKWRYNFADENILTYERGLAEIQ